MKRILIVSDAWHPKVNGVFRNMQNVIDHLRPRQFILRTITPDMFYTETLPVYLEVQLSLFSAHKHAEKYSWNACTDQFLQNLVRASQDRFPNIYV